MNEPVRLHAEPESELERSLLDAGRSYTAPASSRAKALAALGVVGVTASSTTAASAVTKAGIAKWIAATVVIVGSALPALHYLRLRTASSAAPSAVTASALATQAAAAAPAVAPSVDANAGSNSANSVPDPTPANASTSARTEAKPSATPALSAELSALDGARSALASGNPTLALAALDQYARQFPRGRLSMEAEVLRIDALAKSGQTAAAKRRAEAFIKRHPDSVLASRVRAYAEQ
jgi:hypothetical protein